MTDRRGRRDRRDRIHIRDADRPGDLGWIVQRHGELYAEQFGWNQGFEALIARVVGEFGDGHDPAREGRG